MLSLCEYSAHQAFAIGPEYDLLYHIVALSDTMRCRLSDMATVKTETKKNYSLGQFRFT